MSLQGTRPTPLDMEGVKKTSVHEQFVLAYLRYSQFKQTSNPSTELLKKHENSIVFFAKQYYGKQATLFKSLGFEIEDLKNIARIWLCTFLGLHSKSFNQEKRDKYLQLIGPELASKITNKDLKKIDRRNLNRFLSHQFQHFIDFCLRANRNVVGEKQTTFHYMSKDVSFNKTPIEAHEEIRVHNEFEPITAIKYKKFVSEITKHTNKNDFIAKNGLRVVRITTWSEPFQSDQLLDRGYWSSSSFQDTEEILLQRESQHEQLAWLTEFNSADKKGKSKILREFLKENETTRPNDCKTVKSLLRKLKRGSVMEWNDE